MWRPSHVLSSEAFVLTLLNEKNPPDQTPELHNAVIMTHLMCCVSDVVAAAAQTDAGDTQASSSG